MSLVARRRDRTVIMQGPSGHGEKMNAYELAHGGGSGLPIS